jgi:hypothetical protein
MIEDVNYQEIANIQEVIILPLLFENMDGSPCTIMA